MKSAFVIASIILFCTGCAGAPKLSGNDTAANTSANYNFKGDLNHQGADDCWYHCFFRF